MRVLMIDNYDSFTYNIVQYLAKLGADVTVRRNDAVNAAEAANRKLWDALVISPGPGTPDDAGVSLAAIAAAARSGMPLLGVCLGHQSMVQAFGGIVTNAASIMHGKTSRITHDGKGIFRGLPSPITVARYHSLAAKRDAMPAVLDVSATTDDGEIMALRHRSLPMEGVQFHPESIASEYGYEMLQNWLNLAGAA